MVFKPSWKTPWKYKTRQTGQNAVVCSFSCHKRNSLRLRLCKLIKINYQMGNHCRVTTPELCFLHCLSPWNATNCKTRTVYTGIELTNKHTVLTGGVRGWFCLVIKVWDVFPECGFGCSGLIRNCQLWGKVLRYEKLLGDERYCCLWMAMLKLDGHQDRFYILAQLGLGGDGTLS